MTGCILFLISGLQGTVGMESWPGLVAVVISAWLMHRMHAESGMRTRPGSLPSWVWVLVATPFIGLVPNAAWWSIPCFLMGMKAMLRLRDLEMAPGTFLATGAWWSMGVIVCSDMWAFALALVLAMFIARRPASEEWVSAWMGMAAPGLVLLAVYWLWFGRLPATWLFEGPGFRGLPTGAAWILLPSGLGWFVRQRSLLTATAQQRFSRQWTQWAGLFALVLILAIQALQWKRGSEAWSPVMTALPGALAFMAAWSWPWLMPPGFKWTKAAPYAFMVFSLLILFLRSWPWM